MIGRREFIALLGARRLHGPSRRVRSTRRCRWWGFFAPRRCGSQRTLSVRFDGV